MYDRSQPLRSVPRHHSPWLVGRSVPHVHVDQLAGLNLVEHSQSAPVVLSGGLGIWEALGAKWTLDYVEAGFADMETVSALFAHPDLGGRFLYHARWAEQADASLVCERRDIAFSTARCGLQEACRAAQHNRLAKPDDIYLQTVLLKGAAPTLGHDACDKGDAWQVLGDNGSRLRADFESLKWDALARIGFRRDQLRHSVLYMSLPGAWTPLHYDAGENVFLQLKGSKRILLFPPSQFPRLYPFPARHPYDRQSQLRLELLDIALTDCEHSQWRRFPRSRELRGQAWEVVLKEGEALRIPPLWWHQIEAVAGDPCMSVSLWFDGVTLSPYVLGDFSWISKYCGTFARVVEPASASGEVLLMRIVEESLWRLCDGGVGYAEASASIVRCAQEILLQRPQGESSPALGDAQCILELLERAGFTRHESRAAFLKSLLSGRYPCDG